MHYEYITRDFNAPVADEKSAEAAPWAWGAHIMMVSTISMPKPERPT